jgi:hypothetical protein
MNAWIGWALAVLAVAAGYTGWGWQGVVLALTVIVFWLLLQFGRLLRAMKQAGGAPVGHVASAVMLHAKLREGMRLMDIIQLTRSLGRKLDPAAASTTEGAAGSGITEHFAWEDGSGAKVTITLIDGRLNRWTLQRPPDGGDAATGPASPGGEAGPQA